MALQIVFDKLDKDGQSFRRRQRINRTVPASDPTTISLAKPPNVATITNVDVELLTSAGAAAAPTYDVVESAPNIFVRIRSGGADVNGVFTSVSGF